MATIHVCAQLRVREKRGGSVTSEPSSVTVCTVDCACLTALSQTAGARRLLTRVVGQWVGCGQYYEGVCEIRLCIARVGSARPISTQRPA